MSEIGEISIYPRLGKVWEKRLKNPAKKPPRRALTFREERKYYVWVRVGYQLTIPFPDPKT